MINATLMGMALGRGLDTKILIVIYLPEVILYGGVQPETGAMATLII
jgi:hypothetical protein